MVGTLGVERGRLTDTRNRFIDDQVPDGWRLGGIEPSHATPSVLGQWAGSRSPTVCHGSTCRRLLLAARRSQSECR